MSLGPSQLKSGLTMINGQSGVYVCATLCLAILLLCVNSTPCLASNQQLSFGSLRGIVTLRGKPVSGVMVTVTKVNSQPKSSLSNSAGEYEIRGLSPANYLISVGNTPYVLSDAIAGSFQPVEILDNSLTSLNLTLTDGGVLSGCATYVSNQPLVDRQVIYEFLDSEGQGLGPINLRAPTLTDDRGCFRIYGLPLGRYRVGIGKPFQTPDRHVTLPSSITYYPGVQSQSKAEIIKLAPGEERKLGRITIHDESSAVVVSGVFFDRDGAGKISDFVFELVPSDERGRTTEIRTNEKGEFKVDDVYPGRYRIQPAVSSKTNADYTFEPLEFEVSNRDVEDLVVRCTSLAASVKGEVVINDSLMAGNDDCSIALQEGATLDPGTNFHRVVLDRGTFKLAGLKRGVYTLVVMPLRSSLRYQQARVGAQLTADSGAFGILKIDLTSGGQTAKIYLSGQ
jgi:hypothetical protein